jgi:hypothetical protein
MNLKLKIIAYLFPQGITHIYLQITQNFQGLILKVIIAVHGSVVVKALCYKPEGPEFDAR